MFLQKSFALTDFDRQRQVIDQYPLATILTPSAQGLIADHVPLLLVDDGSDKDDLVSGGLLANLRLQGHVARANAVWQAWQQGGEVLAVFQGPQHYISPNWYASKAEDGRVVPTWNYLAVHVRGRVRVVEDEGRLLDFLDRLTERGERDQARPWRVSDSPRDYVDTLMQMIVGVEIAVMAIEGKAKLSQNHPERNRLGVREGLRAVQNGAAGEMLAWMQALDPL